MEFIHSVKLVQKVKNGEHWFGVDYNMNIYKGCNHGCIYCDSRSDCYQIKDFDIVKAKKDAPKKVENELHLKQKKSVIGLGGMNDPYNPYEKQIEYTRDILRIINKYQFGVFVITKSDLVTRDIDIFEQISKHSICNVGLTITTFDEDLREKIEPYSSSTTDRFKAIRDLNEKGIFTGILMMPLLPFINDSIENVEAIVLHAASAGAKYIYPSFGVTLRDNQRTYFYNKIGDDFANKYKKTFKEAYVCKSPNSNELLTHFETLCNKYGILYKMEDIITESRKFVKQQQISLF